jgi:putative ABC transport system substrate-binding protein
MRRREFVTLLGGAAAWPLAARAQQSARMRQIALLTGRAEDVESRRWIEAMRQRLNELGWSDGRNIQIHLRAGGDVEQWQTYAGELVASAPDVIVVVGNPGVASQRCLSGPTR